MSFRRDRKAEVSGEQSHKGRVKRSGASGESSLTLRRKNHRGANEIMGRRRAETPEEDAERRKLSPRWLHQKAGTFQTVARFDGFGFFLPRGKSLSLTNDDVKASTLNESENCLINGKSKSEDVFIGRPGVKKPIIFVKSNYYITFSEA